MERASATSRSTRIDALTDWSELAELDRRHVWHPYAALPATMPALPVVSAQGSRLRLADGRELIDGMASWWCAVHGYRHPKLDASVRDQLERMAHVMFGGLTHEPAVRLARSLVELTPESLQHVFFADSGSVAVEVAIKMALQAQRARHGPARSRLLTVRGGYHGDTFGAMAVCDPVGGMHSLFADVLASHVFVDRPPDGFDAGLDPEWAAHVAEQVERHSHELAAVIVEPVVQGAGGMRFHAPECVAFLRRLCDEHGLLLILDEIATGFGRTGGSLFACGHADVAPDIMCVGKALTGGYMTLSATLCSTEVARTISQGEGGALMHGPTYMANPLACSVALASLELLAEGAWREDVARAERILSDSLGEVHGTPGVADVRVLGAIAVVQLEQPLDLAVATAAAVERGVWLRPFNDLIYAMPPYILDEDELRTVAGAMVAATHATLARS